MRELSFEILFHQLCKGGIPIRVILTLLLVLLTPSVAYSTGYIEPYGEIVPCKSETLIDLGEYTITAYCGCEICCGEWAKNRPNGIVVGSCGEELNRGSCAAPFPCGTVLLIEDLGQYIVQDCTADWIIDKYDGKIVDIYFEKHEEAVEFGKKVTNVSIVKASE